MPQVTIEISYPNRPAESRRLTPGTYVIGRDGGDIALSDPQVSGRHGELRIDAQSVTYHDLGSTNGSFTPQGKRITEPYPMQVGDKVQVGTCNIALRAIERTSAPPAKRPPAARTMVVATGIPNPSGFGPAQVGRATVPPAPNAPRSASNSTPPAAGRYAGTIPLHPPPAEDASEPPQTEVAVDHDPIDADNSPSADEHHGNVWDDQTPAPMPDDDYSAADAQSRTSLLPVARGRAGGGMSDFATEFKQRLTETWEILEPHWQALAKVVAVVILPFAIATFLLSYIPILGGLLAALLSLVEAAVLLFMTQGIVAQYLLRVCYGETPTVGEARLAHSAELGAWVATITVGSLIAGIGTLFLFVPGLILGWGIVPAYLVDHKRGVHTNGRSAELFLADWLHLLQGLVILAVPYILFAITTALLGRIPYLGRIVPLLSAAAQCVFIPFATLYTLRLYLETKVRVEGAS